MSLNSAIECANTLLNSIHVDSLSQSFSNMSRPNLLQLEPNYSTKLQYLTQDITHTIAHVSLISLFHIIEIIAFNCYSE